MSVGTYEGIRVPTLLEACDDERIFGVDLTLRQRDLMQSVDDGNLLHQWALGRRSGKSLLGALIALYWATLKPDLEKYVRRREKRYSVCVATNQRQSKIFIEQARSIVEGSRFLSSVVESMTDDRIEFKFRTVLAAFPCTSRGGRGWPIQFLLLDEAAHMLDSEGNQAAETIFRALTPSVAQFGDDARIIVASSPYGRDGFFAELYHQVDEGLIESAVCAQHATLEMRPDISRAALELERQRDPEGFRSEYGAEFVAPGGAFLDANQVAAAVQRKHELKPGEVSEPIAAIDLGFVHDSTALVIVGRDKANPARLRLALARSWTPKLGPLGFTPTLDEIVAICRQHGVTQIYTDQHSAAAAVEHLQRQRLSATAVPTTPASKSGMFADLKTRLYSGDLELYEHEDLLAELARIETLTTPGSANIRIRRLGSSHGDIATALALACSRLRTDVGPGYRRGQGFAKRAPGNVRPGSQADLTRNVRIDRRFGGLGF